MSMIPPRIAICPRSEICATSSYPASLKSLRSASRLMLSPSAILRVVAIIFAGLMISPKNESRVITTHSGALGSLPSCSMTRRRSAVADGSGSAPSMGEAGSSGMNSGLGSHCSRLG